MSDVRLDHGLACGQTMAPNLARHTSDRLELDVVVFSPPDQVDAPPHGEVEWYFSVKDGFPPLYHGLGIDRLNAAHSVAGKQRLDPWPDRAKPIPFRSI